MKGPLMENWSEHIRGTDYLDREEPHARMNQKIRFSAAQKKFLNSVAPSKEQREKVQGRCWEWQGVKTSGGYGQAFGYEKITGFSSVAAHRVSYALFRGPVPEELVLDHLCKNRKCCNPLHLEIIDQYTNVMRGDGPTALNAKKEKCIKGHELKAYRGRRICLTCKAEHMKKLRAKKKNMKEN